MQLVHPRRCVYHARLVADCHFRIEVPEENLNLMRVSLLMPYWEDLKAYVGTQRAVTAIAE